MVWQSGGSEGQREAILLARNVYLLAHNVYLQARNVYYLLARKHHPVLRGRSLLRCAEWLLPALMAKQGCCVQGTSTSTAKAQHKHGNAACWCQVMCDRAASVRSPCFSFQWRCKGALTDGVHEIIKAGAPCLVGATAWLLLCGCPVKRSWTAKQNGGRDGRHSEDGMAGGGAAQSWYELQCSGGSVVVWCMCCRAIGGTRRASLHLYMCQCLWYRPSTVLKNMKTLVDAILCYRTTAPSEGAIVVGW